MDRIALRNAIVIRSQKNFRPNEKRRPRAPSVISIFDLVLAFVFLLLLCGCRRYCFRAANTSGPKSTRLAATTKTATELLNAAGGVHDLLLSGVKRMAGRTHFKVQRRVLQRRAGFEGVAATAGHGDFLVIGMDIGFHD